MLGEVSARDLFRQTPREGRVTGSALPADVSSDIDHANPVADSLHGYPGYGVEPAEVGGRESRQHRTARLAG